MISFEHSSQSKSNNVYRSLRIVILGAGVSGLAAAHELLENPKTRNQIQTLTILDPRPTVGGLICKSARNGYILEGAAQGVLGSRTSFTSLLEKVDLLGKVVASPRHLKRYLVLGTTSPRLVAVSPNPLSLVLRGVLSLRGLVRALSEGFRSRGQEQSRESLFAFFERRFGYEVAQRLVIPMATGVWGGGAKKLLARHVFPKLVALESRYGSVLKGAFARIFSKGKIPVEGPKRTGLLSFEHGMDIFPLELHRSITNLCDQHGIDLRMRLGVPAEKVEISTPGRSLDDHLPPRFLISTQPDGSERAETLVADCVFSSVPLWREELRFEIASAPEDTLPLPEDRLSHQDLEAFLQSRINLLRKTPSHGLAVIGLGGRDTRMPPQGFGALAPEESSDLLGVLYVHSIVPSHAPKGHFLFRVMIGGDRDPHLARASELECLEVARQWLFKLDLVSKDAEFDFEQVYRWPGAIPLQDEGHDKRLLAIAELEQAFPGLHFIGNYISGVGVHDCLVRAKTSVADLATRLSQLPASTR